MSIPATMTATVLVAPHRFELQQRPVPVPGMSMTSALASGKVVFNPLA